MPARALVLFLRTISATYPAITSVTEAATVYAADVTTPLAADDTDDAKNKVNEDKNGATQRRISLRNSVPACR